MSISSLSSIEIVDTPTPSPGGNRRSERDASRDLNSSQLRPLLLSTQMVEPRNVRISNSIISERNLTDIHRSVSPCFVSTPPRSYQPLAHPLAPAAALLGRRMSHFHPQHIGTHPQIRPSPLYPCLTNALAVAVVAPLSSARERFVRGLRGWARRHFNPSIFDEFPTFFLFYSLD